jgi:hypothetical protein
LPDFVLKWGHFNLDQRLVRVKIRRFSGKIRPLCVEQPSFSRSERRLEIDLPLLATNIRSFEVERRPLVEHQQSRDADPSRISTTQ